MSWINTFLASGVVATGAPADPCDETVINGAPFINGAPYVARNAIQNGAELPVTRPDEQIAAEIKRRQIALVTRYVATVRSL
jgi:hypothetical protein